MRQTETVLLELSHRYPPDMIYDVTLTDLHCSFFSGRDASSFGPRTPICPDEKEFGSLGQKL